MKNLTETNSSKVWNCIGNTVVNGTSICRCGLIMASTRAEAIGTFYEYFEKEVNVKPGDIEVYPMPDEYGRLALLSQKLDASKTLEICGTKAIYGAGWAQNDDTVVVFAIIRPNNIEIFKANFEPQKLTNDNLAAAIDTLYRFDK